MEVIESKGDLGVPRIVSKDITVPMEFNFATQRRAELRPKPQEVSTYQSILALQHNALRISRL